MSVPRSRHCSSGRDRSDEEALFRESDARRLLVESTQDEPRGRRHIRFLKASVYMSLYLHLCKDFKD